MSQFLNRKWTVSKYLAFEQTAEERHEFFNGNLFVVPRSNREHCTIKENSICEIGTRLKSG